MPQPSTVNATPKDDKTWLKTHGHAAKVDQLDLSTPEKRRRALCDIHSVTQGQYRAATGVE